MIFGKTKTTKGTTDFGTTKASERSREIMAESCQTKQELWLCVLIPGYNVQQFSNIFKERS